MTTRDPHDQIVHKLRERVKELTALHSTARILQDDSRPLPAALAEIVALLPGAWQYPEVTSARIHLGTAAYASADFAESPWMQSATFPTRAGETGRIDIAYREFRPAESEGPFLAEERELIDSIADMLRSHIQRRHAIEDLQAAQAGLEKTVSQRTAALQAQIEQYRQAQVEIVRYQAQLRRLASELSLSEERHRRRIATDLHDHIGQALALIRMRVAQFRGNSVFSGLYDNLSEVLTLLDETIAYTRTLTFQISPPVLYELGLESALEWLAEQSQKRFGFSVTVHIASPAGQLDDDLRVLLFQAAQELLLNAAKHASAHCVDIELQRHVDRLTLVVSDDGSGFDAACLMTRSGDAEGFGLFSIRERLSCLSGTMAVESASGRGTTIRIDVPAGTLAGG